MAEFKLKNVPNAVKVARRIIKETIRPTVTLDTETGILTENRGFRKTIAYRLPEREA